MRWLRFLLVNPTFFNSGQPVEMEIVFTQGLAAKFNEVVVVCKEK
jgi:hypothetical protein